MISGIIEGATRHLGAPPEWDQGNGAIAGSLWVKDTHTEGWPTVVTAWYPSQTELWQLNHGDAVIVKLVGDVQSPGITVEVGR